MKKLLVLVIVVSLFNCNTSRNEDVEYILPSNFIGVVVVVFDQINGKEIEYNEKKRVYRIPPNGILKTKFKQSRVTYSYAFYKIDSFGQKNKLDFYPALDLINEVDSNRLFCFKLEKTISSGIRSGKSVRFESVLVTTLNKIDSIGRSRPFVQWELLKEI
jgi:hypothetical protein